MKKILLITIPIVIVAGVVAVILNLNNLKRLYRVYTNDFSGGLGAINSTPSPNQKNEGDSINNLIKSLPVSTDSLTISGYDYSQGKFIVVLNDTTLDLQTEFDNWYAASSYTAIPKSMFLLRE